MSSASSTISQNNEQSDNLVCSFVSSESSEQSTMSTCIATHPLTDFQAIDHIHTMVKVRSYFPVIHIFAGGDSHNESEPMTLPYGYETTKTVRVGEEYFATRGDRNSRRIFQSIIASDQYLYVLYDDSCELDLQTRIFLENEKSFMSSYFNRTGLFWRHYYGVNGPREPPKLHIWQAPYIGYKHVVVTTEGYWHCSGPSSSCQSDDPPALELHSVSLKPNIHIISNFLSDFEADEIIRLSRPNMTSSTVMNPFSQTGSSLHASRTSSNAWLSSKSSPTIGSIFQRAAELLHIDITNDDVIDLDNIAEQMQIVHYSEDQQYDVHYDWWVNGRPESRFITLLMYLNEPEAGGETSFPKAGVKIRPEKGTAVLFYNLLEDGNGDALTLHASLPVIKGEKWLANFWIWDPLRKT